MKTYYPNASLHADVIILIKDSSFDYKEIKKYYGSKLKVSYIALGLEYDQNGKAPVKHMKEVLTYLMEEVKKSGASTILVADGNYFKQLTKSKKTEPYHGYVLPCKLKDYENLNVVLTVNYQALFHNPDWQSKINMSIDTLNSHIDGSYTELGSSIIHSAKYPYSNSEIEQSLNNLLNESQLTNDIETFGLNVNTGMGTIAFANSLNNFTAFSLCSDNNSHIFNESIITHRINLLKEFYEQYKGMLIYHNATFDVKHIIWNCFMKHPLDYKGLVDGLDVMFRDTHCTQIIIYLCTNTTAGNVLNLKSNAHEFAGNYAVDNIKDITLIPLPELLEYNGVDCLSTRYVFDKYYPMLIDENQLDLYENLFRPSLRNITHMELVGMPMDMDNVIKLEDKLSTISNSTKNKIHNSPIVKEYEWELQKQAFTKKNKELKRKFIHIDSFKTSLNPSSGKQKIGLLHNFLDLNVMDLTDTKQPATGKKSLEKLLDKLVIEHNIKPEELN